MGGRADTQRMRNIVVAVDGSEHARNALAWALNNLYNEGDVVHLVHAEEAPSRWYLLDGTHMARAMSE